MEKELFEDYEIKNWEFTPRLFKFFGAGLVLAFGTIFAFGQFNLMQSKACDNAIVGTFCRVLDAAYVASIFAGNEDEWSNADYEKTKIEDADITYIDVSAEEPQLQYPEGYFAIANPEEFAQNQNPNDVMGMPFPNSAFPNSTFQSTPNSNSGTDLLNQQQVLPPQNNDVIKGEIPKSPFSFEDDKTSPTAKSTPYRNLPRSDYPPLSKKRAGKTPRFSNDSPKNLPPDEELANANTDVKTKPEPSPSPGDAVGAVNQFNEKFTKKPLVDFADDIIVKTDGSNKIDLTKPFMVEMQGVLDKDGKLDTKKSRFVDDEGDPNMVNVAKAAIEAVNNSGLLGYLRDQGVEKVTFTLVQDDKQLTAIIKGDQPSEEKARTVSSGINGLIGIAKLTNRDDDLKKLMNAAKFTTEGKSFVMNFALPKEEAHKLIDKKLQEARIKKSQMTGGDVSTNINAKAK